MTKRSCLECGFKFTPRVHNNTMCSVACLSIRTARVRCQKLKEGKTQKKICAECFEKFLPDQRNYNRQKCCSLICTRRFHDKLTNFLPKRKYRVLQSVLKREKVPKNDLLWSFNFYAALVQEALCHYCGRSLKSSGHSLDAMLAGKHRSFNVVPCCGDCNKLKNNNISYDDMMVFMAPALRLRRLHQEGLLP